MTMRQDVGLHYEEQGSGDEVVVMLHGFGCTTACWDGVVPLLDGLRIISFDLPGHGRSAAVASGGLLPNLARSVHEALERLGIAAYSLVGLSMGGAVSVRLALDHPADVKAVVGVVPMTSLGNSPGDPVTAAFAASFGNREALTQGVASISVEPDKTTGLVDEMLSVSEETWKGFLTDGAFRGQADELPGLRTPTTYIVGGRDNVQDFDRQLADVRAMPNGRMVLLGNAGHLCPYEIPEVVAAEVEFALAHARG